MKIGNLLMIGVKTLLNCNLKLSPPMTIKGLSFTVSKSSIELGTRRGGLKQLSKVAI